MGVPPFCGSGSRVELQISAFAARILHHCIVTGAAVTRYLYISFMQLFVDLTVSMRGCYTGPVLRASSAYEPCHLAQARRYCIWTAFRIWRARSFDLKTT